MGKPVTELPDIMLIIAENIGEQLKKDGVVADKAARMGLDCAKTLMQHFGGDNIYVPKGLHVEFSKRDREMVALLDTLTMKEVCTRYNITQRRLYQIIHAVYDGVEKPTQLELFGPDE